MPNPREKKYKRILLKLSGEELMGSEGFGIDPKVLDKMALEIGQLVGIGVQVGLVAERLEKLVVVIKLQQGKCLVDGVDMRFAVFGFTGVPSFCR